MEQQDAQNAAAAQEQAPPKSGAEALQLACDGYASSLALSPAARRQVAEVPEKSVHCHACLAVDTYVPACSVYLMWVGEKMGGRSSADILTNLNFRPSA